MVFPIKKKGRADVRPDFLCVGKGLTGGYLPLSVYSANDVYQAFYAERQKLCAFLHTGNPLARAAAIAKLNMIRNDDVIARNRTLAAHMAEVIAPFADHPDIADVRKTGMIAAMETVWKKSTREPTFGRSDADERHIAMGWSTARGCARSAMSFTSCRRTSLRRRRSIS